MCFTISDCSSCLTASSPCMTHLYGVEQAARHSQQDRVTGIHFCSSSNCDGFNDLANGYILYVNSAAEPRNGCNCDQRWPYDVTVFSAGEVVLKIDACFSDTLYGSESYYVVAHEITIHTNKGTYGPYGESCSQYPREVVGYDLFDLAGVAGFAIDALTAYFQRC